MTRQVAILMPVRGGDPYFSQALQSLVAQTFADWVCYVVADGDAQRTNTNIRSILPSEKVIMLEYPISRRGLAAGLNFGLRHISQPFVARFDSDDLCQPNRLKYQLDLLCSTPGAVMVCSHTRTINESGEDIGSGPNPVDGIQLQRQLQWYNPVAHSSVMFRRRDVLAIGGYNPLAKGCEDYDLWLRVAAAYPGGLEIVTEPLVSYRKHQDQLTKKSMVGPQLSVIAASRARMKIDSQQSKPIAPSWVRSSLWQMWQRFRFP